VEGEVLAAGRKLVGSAQVRIGGVLLQHGSLPFRRGLSARLLDGSPDVDGGGEPAYLEKALGSLPPWTIIVAALRAGWEATIGPIEAAELSESEVERAAELARGYALKEWTWRR
jgi:lipoate-protein ligase A